MKFYAHYCYFRIYLVFLNNVFTSIIPTKCFYCREDYKEYDY